MYVCVWVYIYIYIYIASYVIEIYNTCNRVSNVARSS